MSIAPSRPVTGSIYDGFSPRGQRALADLRAAFATAGFYAEKERRTERTLRVYPERRGRYPLLNPGFVRSSTDGSIRSAAILCPLYSTGDAGLSHFLFELPAIDGCRFASAAGWSGRYQRHGSFILPIVFLGHVRQQRVDFAHLERALSQLHLGLTSIGFATARQTSIHRAPSGRI